MGLLLDFQQIGSSPELWRKSGLLSMKNGDDLELPIEKMRYVYIYMYIPESPKRCCEVFFVLVFIKRSGALKKILKPHGDLRFVDPLHRWRIWSFLWEITMEKARCVQQFKPPEISKHVGNNRCHKPVQPMHDWGCLESKRWWKWWWLGNDFCGGQSHQCSKWMFFPIQPTWHKCQFWSKSRVKNQRFYPRIAALCGYHLPWAGATLKEVETLENCIWSYVLHGFWHAYRDVFLQWLFPSTPHSRTNPLAITCIVYSSQTLEASTVWWNSPMFHRKFPLSVGHFPSHNMYRCWHGWVGWRNTQFILLLQGYVWVSMYVFLHLDVDHNFMPPQKRSFLLVPSSSQTWQLKIPIDEW